MKEELVKTSFPALHDSARFVLSRVSDFGVQWKNTRFDRYLQSIEHAAAQEYPRSTTWQSDKVTQALFWEAANQTQQLVNSTAFWDTQDRRVITRKLEDVMKGADLAPIDKKADHARNTLAELTTAALLHRCHFDVQLGGEHEDIVATIPEAIPFAVECKRPASHKGLQSNLQELRSQLNGRCKFKGKQGLAVIVADRILGLSTSGNYIRTTADLTRVLDKKMHELSENIRVMAQRQSMKLFPTTQLAAIIVVGTIFVRQAGMPFTLGRMAVFCTAATDARAGELVDTVHGYIQRPPRDLWPSQPLDANPSLSSPSHDAADGSLGAVNAADLSDP